MHVCTGRGTVQSKPLSKTEEGVTGHEDSSSIYSKRATLSHSHIQFLQTNREKGEMLNPHGYNSTHIASAMELAMGEYTKEVGWKNFKCLLRSSNIFCQHIRYEKQPPQDCS